MTKNEINLGMRHKNVTNFESFPHRLALSRQRQTKTLDESHVFVNFANLLQLEKVKLCSARLIFHLVDHFNVTHNNCSQLFGFEISGWNVLDSLSHLVNDCYLLYLILAVFLILITNHYRVISQPLTDPLKQLSSPQLLDNSLLDIGELGIVHHPRHHLEVVKLGGRHLLYISDDRCSAGDTPQPYLRSAALHHGGCGHVLDTPHCAL